MKRTNLNNHSTSLQEPKNWEEIFVPTGHPYHSFVDRTKYSLPLDQFLTTPGHRLMALSGLSSIGKTSLLKNAIDKTDLERITLSGTTIRNFEDFSLKLLDSLGLKNRTVKEGLGIGADIIPAFLKAIIGKILVTKNREEIFEDPPDENEIVLKMDGKVIVIEDFHRIPTDTQSDIMYYLKALSEVPDELDSKVDFRFIIVFIPTMNTTSVRFASDIRRAFRKLEIPLWETHDLRHIAEKHLIEAKRAILGLNKLAIESYGLPSLMQYYCRVYCTQHVPFVKTTISADILDENIPSTLSDVAEETWGSSFSSVYRELTILSERQKPENKLMVKSCVDKYSGDIFQMIWYAISLPHASLSEDAKAELPNFTIGSRLEMSIENIATRLELLTDFEKGKTDDVRRYIRAMSDEAKLDYEIQMKETKKDRDPLFEYVVDSDSLALYDPRIIIGLNRLKFK